MAKEVPFSLTKDDPNITADSTFGTTWRDTWKFRCPQHMSVLLKKGDRFSILAYDSGDVEYVAPDALVKIEARDPSGQKVELIYGPENYVSATEFQQGTKTAKLNLDHPVLIKPRDFIVVMTKDSTGMDSASIANSTFLLRTTKVLE
jgi:hypothetical protein